MPQRNKQQQQSGCGLRVMYNAMFRQQGSVANRRCSSGSSIPRSVPEPEPVNKLVGLDDSSIPTRSVNPVTTSTTRPSFKPRAVVSNQQIPGRKQPGPVKALSVQPKPVPGNGISGELDSVLYDYQKAKGSNGKFVRATSGNVMLFGNLGNVQTNRSSNKDPKLVHKTGASYATGNVLKNQTGMGKVVKSQSASVDPKPEFSRALSVRENPEQLKEMGNREFGEGRFDDALDLYERAIALDPSKAAYRSNKAAALTALGRIIEAAGECKEAVRIDPAYSRAHNRLANLYLRLGEAGKALNHYKLAKIEADPSDTARAQTLQRQLTKCSEARKLKDWQTMLKESQSAISFGADSAPQVFAWQAEALMKLHKYEEADTILNDAPKFNYDAFTNLFGGPVTGYILMVRAQVDMAAGRFDEAVSAAQKAAQVDRMNREVVAMGRRAQAVASARSKGNELFKTSRFREASLVYGEGLTYDPNNAILLCNRAASLAKLNQWDKAVDDCTSALKFRPSYTKARLRRANCNAKLERWEAAIQDYEMLRKEMPEDEEVSKGLAEARAKLQDNRAPS